MKKRILLLRGCRIGKRRRKNYQPEWQGPIEGFVVNTINSNLWRVQGYSTFEDLYQDAYVLFLELKIKYAGRIDCDSWFMSLFKRSFCNRITDKANEATDYRRQVCLTDMECEEDPRLDFLDTIASDCVNEGYWECKFEEAPEEVRQILTLILRAPKEFLDVLSASWRMRGKRKVDGNMYLCALLGHDSKKVNLVENFKNYFSEKF